jgi:hypothetical protein
VKKRRIIIIIKLAVFLLLGAAVNVAVAWGCLIHFADHYSIESATELETDTLSHSSRWFDEEVWLDRYPWWEDRTYGLGVIESEFRVPYGDTQDNAETISQGLANRCGWPLLALWGGVRFEPHGEEPRLTWAFLYWRADRGPGAGVMPLRPLWPGFAINTIFYAAILWLLFAAPFAVRRRRRIKRGLCPACAYPVGNSEICTECGKPVRARAAVYPPPNPLPAREGES